MTNSTPLSCQAGNQDHCYDKSVMACWLPFLVKGVPTLDKYIQLGDFSLNVILYQILISMLCTHFVVERYYYRRWAQPSTEYIHYLTTLGRALEDWGQKKINTVGFFNGALDYLNNDLRGEVAGILFSGLCLEGEDSVWGFELLWFPAFLKSLHIPPSSDTIIPLPQLPTLDLKHFQKGFEICKYV